MDMMNMFTKDEQAILRNTSAKYKWIARDRDGTLYVYNKKPKRQGAVYNNGIGDFRSFPFEEIFEGVTWDGGPVRFRNDVLDETERKYLKAVLKPFRNRVVRVVKAKLPFGSGYCLWAGLEGGDYLDFPSFPAGTMYNGMEPCHEYTLEELGINY